MGKFHPDYRVLGRRNRDLGNRAGPPSHMNTNFLQKEIGVKRDLQLRGSRFTAAADLCRYIYSGLAFGPEGDVCVFEG